VGHFFWEKGAASPASVLHPDTFCEQLWKVELGEDIPSFAFNPFDGEDLLLIADSGQMYSATGLEPFFYVLLYF